MTDFKETISKAHATEARLAARVEQWRKPVVRGVFAMLRKAPLVDQAVG